MCVTVFLNIRTLCDKRITQHDIGLGLYLLTFDEMWKFFALSRMQQISAMLCIFQTVNTLFRISYSHRDPNNW